jgi:FKBP-type peptidyl-prolyl cis-trans isomerase SlyD
MQIAAGVVASFHYKLTDETGTELENSHQTHPMTYLHGRHGLLPGLEEAMVGRTVGEIFSVTLQPADGFGEKMPDAEERVPISHLHGAKKWRPGMTAIVQTQQGQQQVTVVKVGHTMATIDTNHPMAGKVLTFDLEITEVREASAEELAHGHAHGPGGHHH